MGLVRADKKIPAGILAILLGSLGIHKFFLGYPRTGILTLGITIVGYLTICLGIGHYIVGAMSIIGIIEGVIYLTKSDSDFYRQYILGRRPWF